MLKPDTSPTYRHCRKKNSPRVSKNTERSYRVLRPLYKLVIDFYKVQNVDKHNKVYSSVLSK